MEGGAVDARRRIEPEPGYVNENENGHGHANEHVNEKNLLVCVLVYVPVLGLVPVYVSVLVLVPVYGLVLGLGLDPPARESSRKLGLAP